MNGTQLTIEDAITAGERGMALANDNAMAADPSFNERAKAVILAHLKATGQCTGEDLVDVAKAHGVVPEKGDRAFGAIFQSMRRHNLITVAGFGARRKGHGAPGCTIWALK